MSEWLPLGALIATVAVLGAAQWWRSNKRK